MISAISWVPKGASKPVLEAAEIPSKEEIEEIVKTAVLEKSGESGEEMDQDVGDDDEDVDGGDDEDVDKSGKFSKDFEQIADGLKELNMENYDDEDDGIEVFSKGIGDVYYPTNELDPYLKDKDDYDSEELEDLTIGPTDAVIVCARNDEDVNQLEVWICEESEGELNTYIHHHVMLDEFLLCTAWLDCPLKGGEKGNFIAVGTMEPGIEIWDLDIIDEVQPCCILGGYDEKKSKKVKKGKGKGKKKYKEDSHTKSVLGLAWNKQYRNVLASASADKRVKIWDVAAEKCNITMEHHTGKVQAVAWNHHAPQVLLSGSFDHSVVMKDGRIPTHSGYRWTVNADVESLAWDPHTEHSFVVSLEDGTVKGFDIRAATSNPDSESKPSFTLHAHDKNVCSISYNPLVPNFLATGSEDKMVKLWDLSNNQPSCVASRNPKAGAVFSISFSVDSPFLLAIGGSKGRLEMWDTSSDPAVSKRFGS
ncbi:hypothetical protein UlMin_012746 [Ulmus minor]